MAYSYGCIMVPVPPVLADSIRGYAETIPEALRKRTEDASNGIPDEVHITVKYGILTEDVNEVAEVVAGTNPIRIKLGRAGVFHNPTEAVIRLSVDSPELRELHNKVCHNLRHVNTYRDYHPHVTVAYMIKREDDPYYYRTFFSDDFEGLEFDVDRVIFSTSSGQKKSISFLGEVEP